MIEQSGVASSIKEQLSMEQRKFVKLKESAKSAKQNQSQYSPSSVSLFAIDSLELKLA